MTVLSEAKAYLADLLAQQRALREAAAPGIKAAEAATAAAERIEKRTAKVVVATWLANVYGFTTLDKVKPEHYGLAAKVRDVKPGRKTAAAIDEAIRSSDIKVNIGWGASYTAKGLTQRLRTPTREGQAKVKRAIAARKRAEAALDRAKKAEAAAFMAAFEDGQRWSIDDIAEHLTAVGVAMVNVERNRKPSEAYEADRMGGGKDDDQYSSIGAARYHVEHLSKKVEDAGCIRCQRLAKERADREARIEAIKAKPKGKMECPDHGKRVGYVGRIPGMVEVAFPDGKRTIENPPVRWCPVCFKARFDQPAFEDGERKAEKVKAQLAKKAPKPTTVSFYCPNPECEWEVIDADVIDGAVTCDSCDVEYDVDHVRLIEKAA